MHNSFCVLIGVVVDNSEEIRTDIKRPITTLALFSSEDKRWNTFIKVIVEKNDDIKKAQNIQEGDIILTIGVPSYMDGVGYCVYANNLVFLSKNKQCIPLAYRKASALEYENNNNIVQVSGKICSVQENKVFVMAKRNSLLRGEIIEHDTIPLYLDDTSNFSEGDYINFVGGISGNKAKGTAMKIDNKEN